MNSFQDLLDQQKRHFATGVTRSYAWRIEQLDRMARLVAENETELQRAMRRISRPPVRSRPSRRSPASARSHSRRAS
jgi:hypothetical protein